MRAASLFVRARAREALDAVRPRSAASRRGRRSRSSGRTSSPRWSSSRSMRSLRRSRSRLASVRRRRFVCRRQRSRVARSRHTADLDDDPRGARTACRFDSATTVTVLQCRQLVAGAGAGICLAAGCWRGAPSGCLSRCSPQPSLIVVGRCHGRVPRRDSRPAAECVWRARRLDGLTRRFAGAETAV